MMDDQLAEYGDCRVTSTLHFSAAARLSYCYSLQSYDVHDLKEYVKDVLVGIPEAWLLWRDEPRLCGGYRSSPTFYYHSGATVSFSLPSKIRSYQALLLLYAYEDQPGEPESLVAAVEALCSDPWADPVILSQWADSRLEAFWRALEGKGIPPYELRFPVNEMETPLQMELKRLGYFCYDYDSDPHHFAPNKVENGFGQLYFAKIKRVRDRVNQPFGSRTPGIKKNRK